MRKYIFIIILISLLCVGCSNENNLTQSEGHTVAAPTVTAIPSKANTDIQTPVGTKELDEASADRISKIASSIKNSTNAESFLWDDDFYYVINSNLWWENNNIILINNKGAIIREFANIQGTMLTQGLINIKEPLLIGLSNFEIVDPTQFYGNYRYGLYLPETDRFIIEPIFDSLEQFDNNLYLGILDNNYTMFDNLGNILAKETLEEDYYFQFVGSYLWKFPTGEGILEIYDHNFKQIHTIHNFTGNYYTNMDYVVLQTYNSNNNPCYELLDDSGKVIISREILTSHGSLPEVMDQEINSIDYYEDANLYQVWYGNYSIMLDQELNTIDIIDLNETSDLYFVVEGNSYYKYSSTMEDSDIILYTATGEEIKNGKGDNYNHILGNNTVYHVDGATVELYNYVTKENYLFTLPGYSVPYIYSPYENLYLIRNMDTSQLTVFYKDSLVFQGDNFQWSYQTYETNGTKFLLLYTDNESSSYDVFAVYTIINNLGEIVYTSPYKETIYNVDENYILAKRGNYIGLMNFEGNFVYKMIDSTLGDD